MLQLRKRRICKVILGGMLANMCVESHLRDLLEQGFETVVAKDATAAPRHPEWGYGYGELSTAKLTETKERQRIGSLTRLQSAIRRSPGAKHCAMPKDKVFGLQRYPRLE